MSASTEVCNTLYHPHVHVSSEQWVTLSLPSKPKPTPVKAWWNLQPGPSCHRHLQHMELPDFGVTSRQTHPPHSPWVKHSQILWFQCQSFADKGHRVRILKQFPSIDFLSALPPMPCFKKSLLSIPGAWHNSFRKLSSVWIGVQPCGAETNDSHKELIKWQKKFLCSQLSNAFLHFSKMSHRVASPPSTTSEGTELFPLVCFYLSERWGGDKVVANALMVN